VQCGAPRKANKVQLEHPGYAVRLQVCGGSKRRPLGRSRGRIGWDGLSIRAAQRMVESGRRLHCQDRSFQREPHLSGSWEFCRLAEESWVRNTLVPQTPDSGGGLAQATDKANPNPF